VEGDGVIRGAAAAGPGEAQVAQLKKTDTAHHPVSSIRRRSSAAERLNPDPSFLTTPPFGPLRVGYPLITGRSQDRNLPPAKKRITSKAAIWTSTLRFTGGGAEAARGADDPEVTGSKPVAGNPSFPTQFSMILQRKVPLLAVFEGVL
jgi:hypothetical protein